MVGATRSRGTAARSTAPGATAPDAVANVSPAPPPASTTLRAETRTSRIGPFRLQQLVLVELALAALVVGAAIDELMLVPAGVVAVGLVVLALMRRRQRSLREWLSTVLELRARQRRAAAPLTERVDPGLAPAVECAPGLRTYAFVDRDRRTVGMIGDGGFLTALLRLEPGDTALRPAYGARALPLGLLHDALEVDGIRLESVQLVQHTQPAPAPHLPEQAVARRSYAPLQAQAGSPALRLTWVALKLDPELCREAVEARGGGLAGAQRTLLRTADQLASRATGAGFRATLLNEEELIAAVATSTCVNPIATARAGQPDTPPTRRTVESQRAWRCDDRWHTTYGVARWPELGLAATPLPRLVSLLTAIPALTTTFSLTLASGLRRGSVSMDGHIRVTGGSDTELTAARHQLERVAKDAKVTLVRLDREQLPGVLATLPLGGAR
ncbi:type VII secretion protein EccE [Streptomyces sp. Z26]|uniref:type VII secretion protein EccE n=1 Tax=Streptomyces sp. Z26 TaxID=2500177 RepID=UPI000EF163F4|nr:type VII secretion protein EccE [Streptomyces sp. Z26]RLL69149.1 type VII secretion protein EccE [Streptomyces sp. Z26]